MEAKLYILNGPQKGKEYKIEKEVISVGRQDKESKWYPDVDLSEDKKVSRKHLKIWQEQGSYWIKDLQSKHGTMVNGEEIKGKENGILLNLYSEIRIGDSVLKFEPENRLHLERNGLRIDLELLETINFSLLHCGFPLIDNLEIHNNSASDFEPQEISFILCGYSREKIVKLPFLKSGQSVALGDVGVELDTLRFEGQVETTNAEFTVKIKDELVLRRHINVLAYNEFSLEENEEHQVSLASFIQPLHPVVQNIVKDIDSLVELKNSDKPNRIAQITKKFYESFSTKYRLDYDKELSYSPKHKIQKVRLPHQILSSAGSNNGIGTCIDLSVLLAACLENAGLKPLLFLTRDKKHSAHAFAGCWQQEPAENTRPLLFDKEEMLDAAGSGKLLLVECTGFTQGKERLAFDLGVEKARGILKEYELLYVLNVYAARKYGGTEGITPLPFVGAPRYSKEVEQVFKEARDLALESRSKILGTPHLLLCLLELKDGIMQKIFSEQGIEPSLAGRKIIKGLQGNASDSAEPKPTYHYEEVMKIAGVIAGRKKASFVEEPHLIEALLEVRSEALEAALLKLSTTPQRCLQALYQLTGLKSSFTISRSFFCDK